MNKKIFTCIFLFTIIFSFLLSSISLFENSQNINQNVKKEKYESVTPEIKTLSEGEELTTVTYYSSNYDAFASEDGPDYSIIRDAVPTYGSIGNTSVLWIGQAKITQFEITTFFIYRLFLFFNINDLPEDAEIQSATLSLKCYEDRSDTDFKVQIQNCSPGYPNMFPVLSRDYDRTKYSGNGGSWDSVGYGDENYIDISLNSAGIEWINESGWTRFCLRSNRDISGTEPTGSECIQFYSSNNEDEYKPKLSITYFQPSITPSLEIQMISNIEENKNFTVTINSGNIPIEGVTVKFNDIIKTTDKNGNVTFTAPSVDQDTVFLVNASKTGYNSNEISITVTDANIPSEPLLELDADSSVSEGESFEVSITKDSIPIENVLVGFLDESYYTDSNGIVTLVAPLVDQDKIYQITAEKSGYLSVEKSIVITDIISSEPQLIISAPSSLIEEESFLVTVTADGYTVEGVIINFLSATYYTDSDGSVSLNAPAVEDDTNYIITASKTDYRSHSVSLKIENKEEIEAEKATIYGKITDDSANPIEKTKICVLLNGKESTSQCVFTDENGRFSIKVLTGTYLIRATKTGFITSTSSISVEKNIAREVNLLLETEQNTASQENKKDNENFIDYTIQEKASEGIIGASISINSDEKTVTQYIDDLTIEVLESTEEKVSFTISANDNADGTIAVIYIGEGTLADLDNIIITYDSENIDECKDTELFFNSNDESEPTWLRVKSIDGLYVFVYFPHFSEHTITISSIIETINTFSVVLIYIAICILVIAPILIIERKKTQ